MKKTLNKTKIADFATYIGVVIAFIVMNALMNEGLLTRSMKGQLVPICCYIVMAVSLNLTVGILGELSLGHAGFMSVGAFTGVVTAMSLQSAIPSDGVRLALAIVMGAIFAGIAGTLVGIPVLRLKSDYLAIATLGFAEIIRALISAPQLDTITNGSYGLKSIPGFSSLFQVLALTVVCIGLMVLLINSSFGRMFKAVREDEIAAEAMGINLFKTKELSFVISSFFAGVSGGMLAMFMRSIDSKTFQVSLTYDILLIVVIGGIGSISGSCIGVTWFNYLMTDEDFRNKARTRWNDVSINIPLFRPGFRMVIFSILLMVVVLFYSRGLMGTSEFSWNGILGFFRGLGKKKVKKAREKV